MIDQVGNTATHAVRKCIKEGLYHGTITKYASSFYLVNHTIYLKSACWIMLPHRWDLSYENG
jgi:hypothetical protein